MSPFDTVLLVYSVILCLTTVSVVYRMIVGPTILDRAVSTDMLVVLVVIAMGLYIAHTKADWAGPAMLSLTGLAFIGTVTFARFVAREEQSRARRPHVEEEPETTTGPLEAVHLDRAPATPDNTLATPDNALATPDSTPGSPGSPGGGSADAGDRSADAGDRATSGEVRTSSAEDRASGTEDEGAR